LEYESIIVLMNRQIKYHILREAADEYCCRRPLFMPKNIAFGVHLCILKRIYFHLHVS